MTTPGVHRELQALFVSEGSADAPLAGIVETLFRIRGVVVNTSTPELSRLSPPVSRDVPAKVDAAVRLLGRQPDLLVVHRDSDGSAPVSRRAEMITAVQQYCSSSHLVAVIPIRMTEAWLLLDETAIRTVAGHPRGRAALSLPTAEQAERMSDPKARLAEVLSTASGTTGRRRAQVRHRFNQHRRQLLERLDVEGPVTALSSWQALQREVDEAERILRTRSS